MFAVSSIRSVRPVSRGLLALAVLGMLLASLLPIANATPFAPRAALASHTAAPTTVTIAGSLQSELGCAGDWQPDCAATHLAYDADDDVWQGSFAVPAGSYEYKAALNDAWDENYGAHAQPAATTSRSTSAPARPSSSTTTTRRHWVDRQRHAR